MAPDPSEKKIDDNASFEGDSENAPPKEGNGNYLVTYSRHLERRLRSLEMEKQLLDTERLRLERELHALRNELDRLRQPPLIEGFVVKILDDGRVIVESSTGPRFAVNAAKKVRQAGNLQAGQHVLLNQRTFAVVEVISSVEDEKDDFWWVRSRQIEAYQWMLDSIDQMGSSTVQIRILREKVAQHIANLRI